MAPADAQAHRDRARGPAEIETHPADHDVLDTLAIMGETRTWRPSEPFTISVAGPDELSAYKRLRVRAFVHQRHIFDGDDLDSTDSDARTVVLVARDAAGQVLGGVRLAPVGAGNLAWWRGSRLVVDSDVTASGVGRALVRAACSAAAGSGALRFDATVQPERQRFFSQIGWYVTGDEDVNGRPHVGMRWPMDRIATLVQGTKAWLGPLLDDLRAGGDGFVGDDAAPVPGTDLVAATDAIWPSMVERDPAWAGWCAVLVNLNDLAAMGAAPIGILDSLAARNRDAAARLLIGLRSAAAAFGVPILGGHTQLGVTACLSVTALGRTTTPIPAGGGRAGDEIRLTADLGGGWRPGHTGRQWDSTTSRSPEELRGMLAWVGAARPTAAKDVSMAGVVGTLGMLAEASGCGAELDVAGVPRPAGADLADWLTCFPGFAMLTAHRPQAPVPPPAPATTAVCGRLVAGSGVALVWPDGTRISVIDGPVTGLGAA
jgi:putative N-acetyltransferase (TIGR04045 family)